MTTVRTEPCGEAGVSVLPHAALVVIEVLRRAWVNLDLIWVGALAITGGLALGLRPFLADPPLVKGRGALACVWARVAPAVLETPLGYGLVPSERISR